MCEDEATAQETASPGPRPEHWRSILGGISFLLGLVSCFTCMYGLISGIPAIVLGVIARRRVPRTGEPAPGASMAKKGIILGVFGILVSIPFLIIVSEIRGVHEAVVRASCQNNLKQIGSCMKMYSLDHDGVPPDRLARIYPEYLSDLNVLLCSTLEREPGDPAHIDEWSDYALVPGVRATGTPADAKVLSGYEKVNTNHEPPGRNELYLDGHVELHRLK